jgi:hypothetical protein
LRAAATILQPPPRCGLSLGSRSLLLPAPASAPYTEICRQPRGLRCRPARAVHPNPPHRLLTPRSATNLGPCATARASHPDRAGKTKPGEWIKETSFLQEPGPESRGDRRLGRPISCSTISQQLALLGWLPIVIIVEPDAAHVKRRCAGSILGGPVRHMSERINAGVDWCGD